MLFVQHTSWYVLERSVSYQWRGRLEVLTLSLDLYVVCCSALLSPRRDDLLPHETLIVLLSKLVIDQVSCLDRLNVIAGYVYLLFTISVLAPNMRP
jgi:hypothetical protein